MRRVLARVHRETMIVNERLRAFELWQHVIRNGLVEVVVLSLSGRRVGAACGEPAVLLWRGIVDINIYK
jgi:hypothetical protein